MNGTDSEWVGGSPAELVHHYKERLRGALSYIAHLDTCEYTRWCVANRLLGQFNLNYSIGPAPSCTCGAAVVKAIITAEVYDERGNPI